MGAIKTTTIRKVESWYRPLFISADSGKPIQIGGFVFYNPTEGTIIGSRNLGWFEGNIENLSLTIERKNKENLSLGHPFYIMKKDSLGESTAVVYLPAELVKVRTGEMNSFEKGEHNIYRYTTVAFKDANGKVYEETLTNFDHSEHSEKWQNRRNVVERAAEIGIYSNAEPRKQLMAFAIAMKMLGLTLDDVIE